MYMKFKIFTISIIYDNIVMDIYLFSLLQLTIANTFCNIKQGNTILYVFGRLINERR